jgi:hypothetical protein
MHQFIKRPRTIISLAILLLSFGLFIQWNPLKVSCKDFQNGQFHFYGKGSHFLIIRKDSMQKEINLATQDTSFWKISWSDDCIYRAKYLYGGGNYSEEKKNLLRNHTTIIEIQKTTPEYYIFKASLDTLNSKYSLVDTVWVKAK